jgi:hypothetical protein
VKVEEVREASDLSITEAHQAVYGELYERKFQEALKRWLADIKRRAYIEIVAPQAASR